MSNVRDTVTLAHKFVHLLGKCGLWRPSGAGRVRGQSEEAYLLGFKEPRYQGTLKIEGHFYLPSRLRREGDHSLITKVATHAR